jgi:hypothetical protein
MSFADRRNQSIRLLQRFARGLVCLSLAACLLLSAKAETPEERENALKAGFLYNFFSYVQWPTKAGDSADAPLIIGIVGEDSFAAVLASLQGKNHKGRPIEVRKVSDLTKLDACHLIFVSASEEKRLRQILDQTKNRAVLTVGEFSGFTREGGMINLVSMRNRYQLEINPDAAEKAGLTISSQLLKLARIVKG